RWKGARQLKQVVDQLPHSLAFAADAVEVFARLSIELVGAVFEQGQAPAVDAAQRRAQVVRYRIGERLQFLVDGFELNRAVAHALVEFGVEPAHSLLRLLTRGDIAEDRLVAFPPADFGGGDVAFHVKNLAILAHMNGLGVGGARRLQSAMGRDSRWASFGRAKVR